MKNGFFIARNRRDSFAQGQVNWPVGNTITMGPVQDTYDGHAVNTASMFLGINVADYVLNHALLPANGEKRGQLKD